MYTCYYWIAIAASDAVAFHVVDDGAVSLPGTIQPKCNDIKQFSTGKNCTSPWRMGDSHQSDKCTTLTENKSFVQLSPRHRYASNRYKCHALNIHFTLYDFNSRLYHFSRVNSHELCGRIPQKLREKKIKNTTTKNRHGNRCKNASSKAINRTYTYLTRSRFQGFSSSISSNMIYFHLARSHY